MKKFALVLIVVGLLLLGIVSPALAYDRAVGCTVDANGNPWTHGGTVTCVRPLQFPGDIVVGSGSLDANGCFEVFIGNGPAVVCTISFNDGGSGQPADQVCSIPTNNNVPPQPYDCGTISTGTGPNAVTLAGFGATHLSAGAFALVLSAIIGGVAVWWRRR